MVIQTILNVIRTPRIFNIGGVIRHINNFFCSIVFSLVSNRQNLGKFKIKPQNFENFHLELDFTLIETSSYFPFIKGADPDCYFNRTHDSISLQYLSLSFYFWLETKRRDDAFGIGGVNLKWWRLLKGPTSPSNNITFICQSSLRHNKLRGPTRQFSFYWSNVILHILKL